MQLNNAKNRPILVAIVVVIGTIGLIFRGGKGLLPSSNNNNHVENPAPNNPPTQQLSEDQLLYKGKKVKITRHAKCRMDCRFLDAYEVDEVIKQNKINQRKSNANPGGGKCPSVAYEGKTRDGQQARIIVGECDDQPILITVIDLDNEYKCACK